jgi:hypothetical protein
MAILERKGSEILDPHDYDTLWNALVKVAKPVENDPTPGWVCAKAEITSGPLSDDRIQIDYKTFCEVAETLPPTCQNYFRASVFMKLQQNDQGCINALQLFNFILKKSTRTEGLVGEYLRSQFRYRLQLLISKLASG